MKISNPSRLFRITLLSLFVAFSVYCFSYFNITHSLQPVDKMHTEAYEDSTEEEKQDLYLPDAKLIKKISKAAKSIFRVI